MWCLVLYMYVGELIVSKYVTEFINNQLQDVSATKAFVSFVQNLKIHSVRPTQVYA